jgi:hypothetical protein
MNEKTAVIALMNEDISAISFTNKEFAVVA